MIALVFVKEKGHISNNIFIFVTLSFEQSIWLASYISSFLKSNLLYYCSFLYIIYISLVYNILHILNYFLMAQCLFFCEPSRECDDVQFEKKRVLRIKFNKHLTFRYMYFISNTHTKQKHHMHIIKILLKEHQAGD